MPDIIITLPTLARTVQPLPERPEITIYLPARAPAGSAGQSAPASGPWLARYPLAGE